MFLDQRTQGQDSLAILFEGFRLDDDGLAIHSNAVVPSLFTL